MHGAAESVVEVCVSVFEAQRRMKTLVLHGALREEFGERFEMAVRTPVEAFRLMDCNYPGKFRKAIENKRFEVFLDETAIDEDHLFMVCGHREIHLRPELSGSKGLGFLFAFPLLGSIFPAGGFLGGLGAAGAGAGAFGGFGSILLGVGVIGVSYLLSSVLRPKDPGSREVKERPSFIFDGPVNTVEQGGPVPLVYGRVRTGSVIISAGLSVERVT